MVLRVNKVFAVITILWVCVIFSFTLQSGDTSSDLSDGLMMQILSLLGIDSLSQEKLEILHTFIRKCAHFTEFFILGVLSFTALGKNAHKMRLLISVGFCALIASADETLQLFVPDREGKILDALLDCAGAAAGITIVYLVGKLILKKRNK